MTPINASAVCLRPVQPAETNIGAGTAQKLDKLVDILGLGQYEAEQLLDLAAKSKNRQVSADLPEYIMERDIVRVALRTAKEVDATDAEWQEFIDRITRRGK